ncbi:substrate-binding domain-containing protein [Nonomuraea dietziae]|uniref:substrate-binding domain-containing protein n=1 Tax=Nonomuraea dietziae TaxID=65515 RepID=UPI003CD07BBC
MLRGVHRAGGEGARPGERRRFDDIPSRSSSSPPLTTIRQDFDAVGRQSIEVLLRQIGGSGERERLVVSPSFVARASTAGR